MVAALCIESTNIGADERRNGGKSAAKKRGKTSEQAGSCLKDTDAQA